MKYRTALLTCCLVVGSVTPLNAEVAMTPAGDGHDTVPVYVDGHGPYPFILDSGADGSAVYQWFADKAHLAKGKTEELSGQTGSARLNMYHLGDVALDGRHLHNVTAYGLPNRHDAGNEAGILGNDFMDGAIVAYDFPCRRIELNPKPVDVGAVVGAGKPPVHTGIDAGAGNDSTLLTLPVTVNGFTGIAVLDTGSRQTRMTTGFAHAAGIDPSSASFKNSDAIFGANSNKMIPRTGPVGTASFGGMTVKDATAQVIELPVLVRDFPGKPAMLLGADLLSRYRLLYDHAGRKIWLRPSQCKL